jgi:hypothetical protein
MYPERVQSMILGCHTENEFRSQVLMRLGTCLNMSYHIWCYINFCVCHAQKKSQTIACSFINEAKNYTKKSLSNGLN